jgi:hypothetical protein
MVMGAVVTEGPDAVGVPADVISVTSPGLLFKPRATSSGAERLSRHRVSWPMNARHPAVQNNQKHQPERTRAFAPPAKGLRLGALTRADFTFLR